MKLLSLLLFVTATLSEDRVVVRTGSSLPGTTYEAYFMCTDMGEYEGASLSQTLVKDDEVAYLVKTQTPSTKLQVKDLGEKTTWFPDESYAILVVPEEMTPKLDNALFLCRYERFEHIAEADVPDLNAQFSHSNIDVLNKQAIANSMAVNEFTETLGLLSGARTHPSGRVIRTRQSVTSDYAFAAEYMGDYMGANALCDDVFFQTFTVQGQQSRNVVCVKTGTNIANEIVVVGAHLDSTSEQAQTLAPGAVDDGSGSVGVMAIARAFAPYQFSRTLHFIGFGGEEQGLVGSQFYVNNLGNNGFNVVAAYLQDMTAYSNRFYGVTIEGTPNGAIQQIMQIQQQNVNLLAPRLTSRQSNNSFGSDHVPFQRAGIPAILLIEQDDTNYPHYHRSTDTLAQTNSDQGNDIAKAVAGAAYDSAGFVGMK